MAKSKEPIEKRTMFAGRFSATIKSKFIDVENQVGREMSDAEIIEFIIQNSGDDAKTAELTAELEGKNEIINQFKAENSKLEQQLSELQKQLDEQPNADNAEEIQQYQAQIDNLTSENDALKAECQDLHNEINEAGKKLMQVDLLKQNPQKGCYTVQLGNVANEMMELTVSRLKKKLNVDNITPEKILVDLFVKYTKERPCDFAYPLVISGTEAQMIIDKHRK